MSSLTQQQIEAAQAFADQAIGALTMERGVHAETVVAGAARMAGTFLFRSFGYAATGIEPGQAVLSQQANEEGPRLVGVLSGVLSHLGVALDEEALGNAPGPEHRPLLGFLETQRLLEPSFTDISVRHGLSRKEAAEAAAVAAALLIRQCASVLDPSVAFGIAVYAFVEGTKTAPDPVML
ncbi:MAG: hypothetical protein MUF79_13720 [Burkholderiales bacterium]|jgi:hypothetical protein|nr:hypothetical protein [Burkholderiales bacterium]